MEQPNVIYPPGHESAPTEVPAPVITPSMPEPTPDKPKSGFKKVLLVILVLLLIGGAGYGAYYYQQQQINNLNGQISTLNSQATNLNKQISTLQSQLKAARTTVTTNQNVVKITNLGFQLTVPDSIKDLTFTTTSTTNSSLSTTSLTTADPACADSAATSGLGLFTKGTGVYNAKAIVASPPTLVKQFNGFYITYSSPQAACSTKAAAQTLQTAQMQALRNALPTASLITN